MCLRRFSLFLEGGGGDASNVVAAFSSGAFSGDFVRFRTMRRADASMRLDFSVVVVPLSVGVFSIIVLVSRVFFFRVCGVRGGGGDTHLASPPPSPLVRFYEFSCVLAQ